MPMKRPVIVSYNNGTCGSKNRQLGLQVDREEHFFFFFFTDLTFLLGIELHIKYFRSRYVI